MKNNKNTTKLQRVQFTIQEIWQALRGDVHNRSRVRIYLK